MPFSGQRSSAERMAGAANPAEVFVRREFCPKTQEAFMKVHKSVVMGLLALILAWAVPAFGQSDRGSITGTVTDPNGGVVANAKVTATSLTTGEVREATTSSEGNYTLPELKATPYKLVVEAAGFKTATIDTVIVAVQVSRHADVQLEIGQLGESVTVTSDAPVLQTDTPVHQTNITERQIKELPLTLASESGGGRSPISFIFLDSSVTTTGYSGQTTGTNGFNFRVNGGQGLGTDILIDGAATRRAENGTFFSEVAPNPNAFQEFTVSTAQYSAEFGNSSGGVINLTIKSGGSKFHGEAFDIVRNEAFNARPDRVRLANGPKPRDRQQDFGFNIGGPVILPHFGEGGPLTKNLNGKTFFFFNYGGYRTTQQEIVDITVPTVRMRNGDFGELLTDPYVLAQFPADPNNGKPFAGVQIFDSRQAPGQRTAIPLNNLAAYQGGAAIDPVGLNIIRLFPLPTRAGVFHNYTAATTTPTNSDNYVGKVDQVISDRQRLAFTFSTRKLTAIKGGFPRLNLDYPANGVWDQSFRSYYIRAQHDYTFSPTLLNHFNAGFSRSFVQNRNFTRGRPATSLGLPVRASQNLGLPLIGFPGYGDPVTSSDPRAAQPAGSTFFSNQDGDNAVELSDFITYVHGKHTFKTGADLRFQQLNDSNHFDIGGQFNFRAGQTANTNDGNQGWPLASLVTGATEFSFNSVQAVDPGMRTFDPSFFFQDDLKLTPRLTLNLGVRYDIPFPRYEHLNKYRAFDPTVPNPQAGGRLGAIVDAKGGPGALQSPYRGLVKPDYSDWGPRVGFAYSVNSKTVVRGGYGLYYAPLIYNDFGRGGAIGYSPGQLNINGGLDAAPDLFLRNFRAAPTPNPSSQVIGLLDQDIDYFDRNFKVGRTAQYSLDLQRELPAHFAISVSYIGNRGTRLRSHFSSLNALPLNALKLGNPLLTKRLDQVTALERAYAQSVGITLPANNDAVYPGFGVVGDPNSRYFGTVAQALRPFPQYSRVINNRMESQGQSWYNAMKIDLQRRFSRGIQAGVSYTYSKLITDAAEDLFGDTPLNGVIQNPYDRRSLRTIAPGSFPHSLVFNYIIELPFGKGKRFLNHGALVDRLVGGFQLSGVQRYRSGAALVPFIAGGARDFLDLFGVGGNLRPNIVGPLALTNNNAAGLMYQYFDTSAFARPPNYQAAPAFTAVVNGQTVVNPDYAAYYANPLKFFGNSAPAYNNFRGQPFFAEDFSILKKTRVTETTSLELGAEFFNLFNRGRFDYPGLNLDDGRNFGVSARTGDINSARKIQVRARFIF
jgi:hypothetical protein